MKALTPQTAKLFSPIEVHSGDLLRLGVTNDLKHFTARFYTSEPYEHNGQRGVREGYPSWRVFEFIRRIPEQSKFVGSGPGEFFKFGATDTTAELISELWPESQTVFSSPDARIYFKTLLLNKARQDLNANNVAHFKEHKQLLPVHSYKIHPLMPLARYQELGLCNSMDNEGYGLFMEQGTGKTAIVIARICNEADELWRKQKRPYLAIIAMPKNLRFNWEEEFRKFATHQGRVTRIRGDELDRTKQLIEALEVGPEDRYTVVLVSYDSLWRTAGLKRIRWDLGVLDESHYVKNQLTKRWKACKGLRDRCRQRMVLTGTPITNTVMDLYTQLEFLGQGWSGFSSYRQFKRFYGVFEDRGGDSGKVMVGVQNLPFMQERLARQALMVKKDEVLKDLPQKQYDVYETEMTEEQWELYKRIRTEVEVKVENTLAKGLDKTMTVNNILTEMLRLAQVTSGFAVYDAVINDDGEEEQAAVTDRIDPNPKLEALIELLKAEGPNDKVIVWCCFIQDIKTIMARLKLEGIEAVSFYGDTSDADRIKAVKAFNENPKCKVFVGNPAAGGTGLNLLGYPPGPHADLYDTNASHVIYFSQNWSMPARAQSEDRAHRRGTRVPVRYTDLMIPGTIDQIIRERVTLKREHADNVQDVRDILKAVFDKPF